ncbi:MAG: ATP-binding cassette domain-containing protein [Myxococcales bacterium]|nr:ATP-binding cassette domain-containing protein [Myxococcales bacterium]
MTPLIAVNELSIGWGDDVLLEHASFAVERGDIFVIVGGSGCGKSTLLRTLIGLDVPMSGSVKIDGTSGARLGTGRPEFGVMFQSGALLGSMTVGENLALQLTEWSDLTPDAVSAIVRAKLRLVGLQGAEDKMPNELSGGMKKRVAIARAMVLEPTLLFLDEPSAGLDPVSSFELDALILSLNQGLGLTVVMVSHELESIFAIGSRCIMLDRDSKRIIASGEPQALRTSSGDPRVSAFFNRHAAPVPPPVPSASGPSAPRSSSPRQSAPEVMP